MQSIPLRVLHTIAAQAAALQLSCDTRLVAIDATLFANDAHFGGSKAGKHGTAASEKHGQSTGPPARSSQYSLRFCEREATKAFAGFLPGPSTAKQNCVLVSAAPALNAIG